MRRREAGRGAAPASPCTQHGHSGGGGAPPGTTMSPCQELTDSPGPSRIRKARPAAEMRTPQMSMRGMARRVVHSLDARPLRYFSACGAPEGVRRVQQWMRTP
jgi:hypothetical protein